MVMPRTVRLLTVAAMFCALGSSGCSRSVGESIRQLPSSDGQFTALIHQDEGSSVIGGNWYAVVLRKARPMWQRFLTKWNTVCTLQGKGKLRISWADPRELVVTCSNCDRKEFFMDERTWKGVTIKYEFKQPQNSSTDKNSRSNGGGRLLLSVLCVNSLPATERTEKNLPARKTYMILDRELPFAAEPHANPATLNCDRCETKARPESRLIQLRG